MLLLEKNKGLGVPLKLFLFIILVIILHGYLTSTAYWHFLLTHCSQETPKRVIGKQCRPRSDAAECGIWSGYSLFANSLTIFL